MKIFTKHLAYFFQKSLWSISQYFLVLTLITLSVTNGFGQRAHTYEGPVYTQNQTLTYYQAVDAYQKLDAKYPNAKLFTLGNSDSGFPIYCFIASNNKVSDWEDLSESKRIFMINNGIHPGESCGVDASLEWVAKVLETSPQFLDSVDLAIIPMYNVGGSLNRRPATRANQKGPEGQGFRGNAKHLDLNRDFLKADSKNTILFYHLFRKLKPTVFIDNHSSNGANYIYNTSLIISPPEKIGKNWESLIKKDLLPTVYQQLIEKGTKATHYVNVHGKGPQNGYAVFGETPIYSSGYAGLWPCWSIVSETHMLKPYKDRVVSTYRTLDVFANLLHQRGQDLEKTWNLDNEQQFSTGEIPLVFEIDSTKTQKLLFEGYTEVFSPSKVYKGQRRSFDTNQPYKMEIPYYHALKPTLTAQIPKTIYISQAQSEVLTRIYAQGIIGDTIVLPKKELFTAHIQEVAYAEKAYEGHVIATLKYKWKVWDSGYYLPVVAFQVNSGNYRYLLNVLSPMAPGSFYRWNFFDSYYQQKEYFSDYIYEDDVEQQIKSIPGYQPKETQSPYAALFEFYKKDEALFEKDAFTPPVFIEF